MATLLPNVILQFLDGNGFPLAGGKLFSFAAGTNTPQATFTDETEITPNANPTILDANGRASVWINGSGYKFTLQDSLSNVLWTVDDVFNITPGAVVTSSLADGAVTNTKLATGVLSADSTGRALMAAGYIVTAAIGAKQVTAAKIADSTITAAQLAASVLATLVPTGSILAFGGKTIPSGFLLCDGTSYLIATYPALAAALLDASTSKYAYGSVDVTHFNVPDGRGYFLRGTNNGAGTDPDAASRIVMNTGGNTGDNIGSAQADQFKAHSHTVPNNSGGSAVSGFAANASNGATFTSNAAGGNETRPLNVYVNYIIKT